MEAIDPVRVFEIKGQVYQLYTAALAFTVANNQSVVAAITGKRIRVMGMSAFSDNGAGGGSTIALLDASGGTVLYRANVNTGLAQPPHQLPVINSGYFETTAGNGLFLNGTVAAGSINVFYIAYTP
jgi:hypothetical protein